MVIDGVNGPREVNPLEGIKGPSVENQRRRKRASRETESNFATPGVWKNLPKKQRTFLPLEKNS